MATAVGEIDTESNHLVPGLLKPHPGDDKDSMTYDEKTHIERKLNRRLPLLERDLVDRPIRHGARNYVAVLYYRTGQKEKAIDYWKKTIQEDSRNLNAIQDLGTVYKELGLKKQSEELLAQLDDIRSTLCGNPDDERRVYGRCMAEQAFLAFWDYTVSKEEHVVKRLKSALDYAGSVISQEEKEDWILGTAEAYKQLTSMYLGLNDKPQYMSSLDDVAKHLHILLTSCKQPLHKARAWAVLGKAFNTNDPFHPISNDSPPFIRQKYSQEWRDPSLCYKRALSLDPGNSWILGNYGHYCKKRRKYTEAIEYLDESIQNDPSEASWFSYHIRAEVNKILATKTQDKQKKRTLLQRAKEDAKMAQKSTPNTRSRTVQGEIAQERAKCAQTDSEKEQCSLEALIHFSEALNIKGGKFTCDPHLKQGKGLLSHDRWSAIQSFKMAYSAPSSPQFCVMIAKHHLLPSMLSEYRHAEQDEQENRRAELAFWLMEAKVEMFYHLGTVANEKRFQREMLDVMEYIVDNMPRNPGLGSMISDGFHALLETRYKYENFQRLIQLQRRHSENMRHQPSAKSSLSLPDHEPPKQAHHKDFKNDFYVITAEASTPWVQYSLLPGMECRLFSYKGFYIERDTALGMQRLKSQAAAIEASAYVLLVLTPSFSASNECQHLFEIACANKNSSRIAVLIRESTEVPREMCQIKNQFDFSGPDATIKSQWFELAKFLLRE